MPAYWNQFMGHLSERRARWTAHHDRTREGWSQSAASAEKTGADNVTSTFTRSTQDAPSALDHENERLKRELADLRAQVDELKQVSQKRAAVITDLVSAMRYLRRQYQRWSSISSAAGLGAVSFDDECSDSDDSRSSSDLSASFNDWSETGSDEDDPIGALPVMKRDPRRRGASTATGTSATTQADPPHDRRRLQSL